jgi:hypothetical protein
MYMSPLVVFCVYDTRLAISLLVLMRMCCRYLGSGLKGPVGEWAKKHMLCHPSVTCVQYDELCSWSAQLRGLGARHVVFALGYAADTVCIPRITTASSDGGDSGGSERDVSINCRDYDQSCGRIAPFRSLFGGGIAFPHNVTDAGGYTEPWVGFAFSIKNTSCIIDEANKAPH